MKVEHLFIAMTAAFLLVAAFPASAYSEDGTRQISSGLVEQAGVAVTVYNVNLGLVKDRRKVTLPRGRSELRFMDVASQIIPTSVSVRSLADRSGFEVLEQNYEYDLLNPQKLLDKYVGKDIKLYQKNPYTEREEVVTATLISNNGGPIYKINGEITFGHPGRILFPGVPENLISKPTLLWLIENRDQSPQEIETSYLTNNINWRADYIVTLNDKDERADISGWVTIDNKSGATYRDATIKLVAGDINRVREEAAYGAKTYRLAEAMAKPAPQFKEEAFFEYHIYTLQRPSTIKENQTKQIRLVTAEAVPVKKELIFKGSPYYYFSKHGEAMTDQKVGVFIEIMNKKEHNLGIPLPKGIVRVYKNDVDGSLQFIGEDSIDHTPKDEKIRIRLGDAFDVVGDRKQTEWKKIAYDTYEASYEISLRNHKKEDVVVRVVEPIPGDWTMLESSHAYKKTDASTAEFSIPVAKDTEAKLTYRVRMRF